MLEITLIKSTIGYKPKAKLTVAALGLKKLNQSVIKSDTCLLYTSDAADE